MGLQFWVVTRGVLKPWERQVICFSEFMGKMKGWGKVVSKGCFDAGFKM